MATYSAVSGEQPLSEHSSCLLGSVNLPQYVINPFSDSAQFNFEQFETDVYVFNRMLDNVVDISNLPLEIQRAELLRKRRHGIGFLGLGTMLNMMKIRYGDPISLELTRNISKLMAETSIKAGIDLAKEKGPAPVMNEEFVITEELMTKNAKIKQYHNIGDIALGKELIIYSDYMQRFPKEILLEIKKHGMRFSHATSIAPTGTMALGIKNNVSNGIEPTFEHEAIRNIIKIGKKTKEATKVYSYEALLYKEMFGKESQLPDYFISSSDITPMEHINIQAAAQPYIDSSISKCIAKGTRIITDKGLIKVESFSSNKTPSEFEELDNNISALCSDNNYHKISSHYCDGKKPTKKLTFDNGIIKEVSLTHKFIDADTMQWKSAVNFKINDKILYKAAKPLEFNSFEQDNYGFIHGILQNPKVVISKNNISSKLKFIDLTKFCSIINSLKDLKLECKNNTIQLSEAAYNFISKLRFEFSWNKLFRISLIERESFINAIKTNYFALFTEKFDSREAALNISELLYTIGKDSAIVNGTVLEISKKYIHNDVIASTIVKIEDSENELFDISVEDKHEYIIHGFISHNTINCPTDIKLEDFKTIYINAYDKGLKGVTCFRFNPEAFQGVIVREEDIANTKYKITLEDNSEIVLSGNELVIYDDNESTVANLYDAIKEGYYGKF